MKNNRLNRITKKQSPHEQTVNKQPVMYNGIILQEALVLIQDGFSERLAALRLAKGVSAREMSFSIGQAGGYINNIENKHNLPSMNQFFTICEYLEITPQEFFSYTESDKQNAELWELIKNLDEDGRNLLIQLAKRL